VFATVTTSTLINYFRVVLGVTKSKLMVDFLSKPAIISYNSGEAFKPFTKLECLSLSLLLAQFIFFSVRFVLTTVEILVDFLAKPANVSYNIVEKTLHSILI
jgi:hypothetical protein